MAASVVAPFKASGVEDVLKAFKTIREAALQAARAEDNAARTQGDAAERVSRRRKRAADDDARTGEQSTRRREQNAAKWERLADRLADQEARAAKRAADATARAEREGADAVEREAKRKEAADDRWQRRRLQIMRASSAQEQALAAQSQHAAEKAHAERERWARSIGRSVSSSAGRVISGIATVGAGALALGGGFSVVDAATTGIANRGKAKEIEIQAGGEVTAGELLNRASAMGTLFGASTGDVLGAVDKFGAKSGKYRAGYDSIRQMVELSTATGADLGQVGELSGLIHLQNGGDGKDTMDTLRMLAGMGRAGSVDMRELAEYGNRIMSSASRFTDRKGAVKQFSAITQAAALGGASSSAEATESIARFGTETAEHWEKLRDAGVNVWSDKAHHGLRDPMSIIKDMVVKGHGAQDALKPLGLMGERAALPFLAAYNQAADGTTGTAKQKQAAGLAAMDQLIEQFADKAMTEEQAREEAARRVQEVDKQLASAMNELRDAVAEKIVPMLPDLVRVLRDAIPAFTQVVTAATGLAQFFLENPGLGVAEALATAIAIDIGKGLVSKAVATAIQAAIMAAMGTGGAGAAAAAGAGGAGGAGAGLQGAAAGGLLGRAAPLLGAAAIGASAFLAAGTLATAAREGSRSSAMGTAQIDMATALNARTPEEIAAMQERLQKDLATVRGAEGTGFGDAFTIGAAALLPGESSSDAAQAASSRGKIAQEVAREIDATLKMLSERLAAAAEKGLVAGVQRAGLANPDSIARNETQAQRRPNTNR